MVILYSNIIYSHILYIKYTEVTKQLYNNTYFRCFFFFNNTYFQCDYFRVLFLMPILDSKIMVVALLPENKSRNTLFLKHPMPLISQPLLK